jgi:23S rRNA-/tRNA-specific pseudouridylate synthase
MMSAPARCLVVAAAEAEMKLVRFLQRRLSESRPLPLLHKWIRSGQIRVNGRRSKAFARLAEGDIVRLPPFALPASFASNANAELPPRFAFPSTVPNTGAEPPPFAFPASSTSNASAGLRLLQNPSNRPRHNPEASFADSKPLPAPGPETEACKPDRGGSAATPPALGPGLGIVAVSGDLLVLNKSAGLSCHPGSASGRNAGKTTSGERAAGKMTAGDSVSARLSAAFVAYSYIPAPVHRLDKRTSGLLLAGLSHTRTRRLHELFRQGGIARYYLAWSWGCVPWDGTRILKDRTEKRFVAGRELVCALPADNPEDPPSCASLSAVAGTFEGPHPPLPLMPGYTSVDITAKPLAPLLHTPTHAVADATEEPYSAQTLSDCSGQSPDVPIAALFPRGREGLEKGRALCAARVVQRLKAASLPSELRSASTARGGSGEPAATLLLLRPLTGHKHQLRAQLAARGFPLIGDPLYGGPLFEHLLLHACALRLPPGELATKGESELFFLAPPWGAPFTPATAPLLQQICIGSDNFSP